MLGEPLKHNVQKFKIPAEEIRAAVAPMIVRDLSDSPEWDGIAEELRLLTKRRMLKRMTIGRLSKRLRRNPESMERSYDNYWIGSDFDKMLFPQTSGKPMVWRELRALAMPYAVQRPYHLYLTKIISTLSPQSVVEIGSGNGLNLFVLAGQFPQISFSGMELTQGGVIKAQNTQKLADLPDSLAKFSPYAFRDPAAFKRIVFSKGSAAHIPFADMSFDMVFTVLALEKMESIRKTALKEITRVARRWVVLIEPFRDVNDSGIQRDYCVGNDYFRGRIKDLENDNGLRIIWTTSDIPADLKMNTAIVVAEKR